MHSSNDLSFDSLECLTFLPQELDIDWINSDTSHEWDREDADTRNNPDWIDGQAGGLAALSDVGHLVDKEIVGTRHSKQYRLHLKT